MSSSSYSDGLRRAAPASVGVDSRAVMAMLDDIEAAGLELHDIMLWREGAVVAEGWRWPYRADRMRMTHSMTKSIVACAIGMLIDEGRLALSDKVAGFFPEIAIDPGSDTARMTIEDLLTMRAGHGSEVSGSIWRGITTSWIDEFFRIPLEHAPGTVHVYTSAASYMLSTIVTRVTGETTHDFLQPRLFDPLGIKARWDIGPDGINPGGNGVSWTTADGLKLGILHAQGGVWNGERILSEHWVSEATRNHVDDYGYHWVVRGEHYAALGIFVQMVQVFPEANIVLAINGAMDESAVVLPHIRRYFPHRVVSGATDAGGDAALARRLAGWDAEPSFRSTAQGDAASLAGGWSVDANVYGLTGLNFAFAANELAFAISDAEGEHRIVAGIDGWTLAPAYLPGADLHHGYRMEGMPTIAGARWIAPDQLELVLHFTESAFRDTFVFTVTGDRLSMARGVNINSGARAWPTITAARAS